jgi:hypothetical protein
VHILWLDVCDEPGLSRLCLAPKSVFELPKECEDERLSVGLFLSDIAEIRRGESSHVFRKSPVEWYFAECVRRFFTQRIRESDLGWESESEKSHGRLSSPAKSQSSDVNHALPLKYFHPDLCLTMVGSERTLSVQLCSDDCLSVPLSTPMKPSSKKKKSLPLSVSSNAVMAQPIHSRERCVDMLRLLSLQSLSPTDLKFRQKRFGRCTSHPSCRPLYPNQRTTQRERDDAMRLEKLLSQGIEVDEENFNQHHGTLQITHKRLIFDKLARKLLIRCCDNNSHAASTSSPAPASVSEETRKGIETIDEGEEQGTEDDIAIVEDGDSSDYESETESDSSSLSDGADGVADNNNEVCVAQMNGFCCFVMFLWMILIVGGG